MKLGKKENITKSNILNKKICWITPKNKEHT